MQARGSRPLKDDLLRSLPKEDVRPEVLWWRERGGTPGNVKPEYAEIPLDEEMAFWVALDGELIGANHPESPFPRPDLVEMVLRRNRAAIELQLHGYTRGLYYPAGESAFVIARHLLKQLHIGRAMAQGEAREKIGKSSPGDGDGRRIPEEPPTLPKSALRKP